MFISHLSLILLSLGLSSQLFAGDASTLAASRAKVVNELKSEISYSPKLKGGGVVVSIIKDDKVVDRIMLGYADAKKNIKMDEKSIHFIASLAKSLTVQALFKLKAEGKIDFSQKISEILPAYPEKNGTVENLINHTSGLSDDDLDPLCEKKNYNNDNIVNHFKNVSPAKIESRRGNQDYCNLGYALLASIVEKVSGQKFKKYILEMITGTIPVGNFGFSDETVNSKDNFARPYDNKGNRMAVDYCDQYLGFASMTASIEDLEKWVVSLQKNKSFGDAVFNNDSIIADGGQIVFGWSKFRVDDKIIYRTAGRLEGTTHLISYIPADKIWIIQLSNVEGFRKFYTDYFLFKLALNHYK